MADKTPEEIAAEEKAAEEAAAQKAAEEAAAAKKVADEFDGDDFDAKRAKATILAQRESERKLKEELRQALKAQDKLDAIEQAQKDADKSAAEKLADRDETIKGLKKDIAEAAVKADFVKEADFRGITDLKLAYLAAKEQGFLGAADPKTGEVGEHDFEKLEEAYPTLQGEGSGWSRSGDAGVRSKGKTGDDASQFNAAIRGGLRR